MKSFDRFADRVAEHVAKAGFFAFCLGLVAGWTIALPFMGYDNQLWHLALNSPTTAITFLLVALLHNTQHRFEQATNERLHDLEERQGGDPVQDDGQRPDRP